jgi:ketosteroid isomerase-like protein
MDPQELAQLLAARANAGDVEGVVALYEPGAVLATGSGQVARGEGAIRTFYAALLATSLRFSAGEQRQALVCGELALTSTRLPDGTVTAEVARLQADGSWHWAIDQSAVVS